MQRRDMLNLTSALLAGTAMTLTITQGGYSASASTAAWGDGGQQTISITATRTAHQVAPDSVIFGVDLSEADFDTPTTHPATDNEYRPHFHNLIYLWDFDTTAVDDTDYSAPTNLPAFYRKRRYGKGPEPVHCYPKPGTYIPKVLVYEPSSGKWGVATLDGDAAIEVKAPEDVYTKVVMVGNTAPTLAERPQWVIDGGYATGDGSLVLAAASEIDNDQQPWQGYSATEGCIMLFRRGDSFWTSYYVRADKTAIGAFGEGDNPPFEMKPDGSRVSSLTHGNAGWEFRIHDVAFDAGWDQTAVNALYDALYKNALTDYKPPIYNRADNSIFIADRVEFRNYGKESMFAPATDEYVVMHANDCIFTGWAHYCVIGGAPSGVLAITGCQFADDPAAISTTLYPTGGDDYNWHPAAIRADNVGHAYLSQNDVYLKYFQQPAIKLHEWGKMIDFATPYLHQKGERHYLFDSIIEGGTTQVNVHGGVGWKTAGAYYLCDNTIIDGNILIADSVSKGAINSKSMGVTIRNNLSIVPNAKASQGAYDIVYDLGYPGHVTAALSAASFPSGSAPVRLENNTTVIQRTVANNGSEGIRTAVVRVWNAAALLDVYDLNNVVRFEDVNMYPSGWTEQGPSLNSTPIPGIESRNAGVSATGYTTFSWGTAETRSGTGQSVAATGTTTITFDTPMTTADYKIEVEMAAGERAYLSNRTLTGFDIWVSAQFWVVDQIADTINYTVTGYPDAAAVPDSTGDTKTPANSIWTGDVIDGAATRTSPGPIGPAALANYSGWFNAGAPSDRNTVGAVADA